MKKILGNLFWFALAIAGAWAYATIAFRRGEPINSAYIVLAALCSYAIGYRFYSKWIAVRVLMLNDRRATPCEVHDNGKALGQMVKEELNTTAGIIALVAILAIMIILLGVLALVVVTALAESPWGVFTVGTTIPIAIFMGCYLRFGRIGKVLEASAIGVIGLLLAVWGGKLIHQDPHLAAIFSLKDITLAWTIIIYGLAASVLPVWFLLAPRDYLSTFVKLGTIVILVLGVLLVLPNLKMPAITKFVDG